MSDSSDDSNVVTPSKVKRAEAAKNERAEGTPPPVRGRRGRARPRRAKRAAASAATGDPSSSKSHAVSGSGSDDEEADESTMSASSDHQHRDDDLSSSARSIPVSTSSASSSSASSHSSDLATPSRDSSTLSDSTPRTPDNGRSVLRDGTPLGNASSLASSFWRISQAALDAADRGDDDFEEEEDDDILAGIGMPHQTSEKSRRILSVANQGRRVPRDRGVHQGAGSADASASSSRSVDPELGNARKVRRRKQQKKHRAR